MSLECYVGPQGNLLEMHSSQCDRLLLKSPILHWNEFQALKNIEAAYPSWSVAEIDITFDKSEGLLGYTDTIDKITKLASEAIDDGKKILIITDRRMGANRVSISSLIAISCIHHHLIRNKQRSQVALILETGEAREIHHFCVLLGYGCDGVYPYLAMETLVRMNREGLLRNVNNDNDTLEEGQILENYKHAIDAGILKVMSKMGISTLASYKGAQIFEALGLDNSIVDLCFTGTSSRIRGVTFSIWLKMPFLYMSVVIHPDKPLVNLLTYQKVVNTTLGMVVTNTSTNQPQLLRYKILSETKMMSLGNYM